MPDSKFSDDDLIIEISIFENESDTSLDQKDIFYKLQSEINSFNQIGYLSKNREFILKKETKNNRRNDDWSNSRIALTEALHTLRPRVYPRDNSLEIHYSIAHTNNIGFAACAVGKNIIGIGVDIECSDRNINQSVGKKIFHSEDIGSISVLEKWVMKEAIFKSIPNNKGITLSNIPINHYLKDEDLYFSTGFRNTIQIYCKEERNKYLYAIAVNRG